MAATYTISEALNVVSSQLKRDVEDRQAAYLANIAQNEIWNKYDWRETLAPLPPFYLIPNEQDYGAPAAIIPTDFLGLREAYLVNTTSSPARKIELKIRKDVRSTGAQALPSILGYEPSVQRFRTWPRVPAGIGATDWLVDGTYKIRPTKITVTTLQTTVIPWDDMYFQVYVAALKWAALDAAGDPRAGAVQVQGSRAVYTGALGSMHDAIDRMAEAEGLNLGDPSIAPSEALVNTGFDFTGLGGF